MAIWPPGLGGLDMAKLYCDSCGIPEGGGREMKLKLTKDALEKFGARGYLGIEEIEGGIERGQIIAYPYPTTLHDFIEWGEVYFNKIVSGNGWIELSNLNMKKDPYWLCIDRDLTLNVLVAEAGDVRIRLNW